MAAIGDTVGPSSQKSQLPIALWSADTTSEDVIENALQDDPDLSDVVDRLDADVVLDPDRDLGLDVDSSDAASDSITRGDSDSLSSGTREDTNSAGSADDQIDKIKDNQPDDDEDETSSAPSAPKHNSPRKTSSKSTSSKSTSSSSSHQANGSSKSSEVHRKNSVDSSSSKRSQDSPKEKNGKSSSTRRNPLQMLKKLTKFDKSTPKRKSSIDYSSEFAAVVVDRLPQVFVVKYLGHRVIGGICGLHHVRRPVDEMVRAVKDNLEKGEEVELPLLYVVVSPKGLDLREHKRNKVSKSAPLGVMPIDFISYGVQDIKYWRVFTCIVVRELSSRSRTATCHAFLCDSSHNGRKMALALGAAFNVYSKKLKSAGKVHNFQIELRPPDQLADAVDAECDA